MTGVAFKILLAGDIMLRNVPAKVDPFLPLRKELTSVDLCVANLEIPLTNVGAPTARKSEAELKARTQYVLRADPAHAAHLAEGNIRLVSLGNNHQMDYGPAGLAQELALLDQKGIAHTGAGMNNRSAYALAVSTLRNGTRIGLLSALAFVTAPALRKCTPATTTTPGVAVLSFNGVIGPQAKEKLARWIGAAKSKCDFLIVAAHWGVESQTKSIPYQKLLGHAIADAGADLVVGHHPHVLQGSETYHGVPIFYSLGNFVNTSPAKSAVVEVTVADRKVTAVRWIRTEIRGGMVGRLGSFAKHKPFVPVKSHQRAKG